MTTVVSTSHPEASTPGSYVSRWIAQSHGAYQKKATDFYSSSACDYQSHNNLSFIRASTPLTTWQAQVKSRLNPVPANASSTTTFANVHDNGLKEKLHQVRALLDAKKQRACRHLSSASTSPGNPLAALSLPDQVHRSPVGGDQSSPPPPPLALENVYQPHDESQSSSSTAIYSCHSCLHHPSLPCLMEESPSDSGLSDGTKTTNQDEMNESSAKNAALIDLSKPLTKEEMLAIMQIVRELWKKQFDCDIPNVEVKPTVSPTLAHRRLSSTSNHSITAKNQYHSTPALNKLSAELSDIKDKLQRFATDRQAKPIVLMKSTASENSQLHVADNPTYEDPIFVPFGAPPRPEDFKRMQEKKDALIRRQIQRREEQLVKKNERQVEAAERLDEYRLFEEYLAQRRHESDQRRTTILQAHQEQKRIEADPPSANDFYFAAARRRNRLKRKPSITSCLSFEDELSFTGSSLDTFGNRSSTCRQTPPRSVTRFDLMSPSLTATTAASRSKMNRTTSSSHIDGQQYDSFTSLNSKATVSLSRPSSLFGGSLMNLSKTPARLPTPKRRSMNLADDSFDMTGESPLSMSMNSLGTSIAGARLARSQSLLGTKSNKQAILNSLKQVVLAGPANERQREVMIREIELSEARHFVLLFRDHRLQFRAVYVYIPETDIIEKLYGIGPNVITEIMVDKWYKYNSGCKRFSNIPIRHFSIQCDAILIHNDFWQKKLSTHLNKLY